MKFVIARMAHESHTFIPETTKLKNFNDLGGDELLESEDGKLVARGMRNGLAAYIDLADSVGAEYVIPVIGSAWPSGPVEDPAFESMGGKIISAVEKGCDAVLLDLHGSMVTTGFPDPEGELLVRIRNIAPDIPIAVALDFHCTLTSKMIDNATTISIYRTTPHIDTYETGQRAGQVLLKHLNGECRAVMAARRIPLMASLEKMGERTPPMKELIEMLSHLEVDHPDILLAGLSGGHPFTDVGPGGMTAVIITDDNPAAGVAAAEKLLASAWENREGLIYHPEPYLDSLETAKNLDEGPIIMADSGDIPSSGGYGADMTVLKAALEMEFEDMGVGPIFDPESARIMFDAGVGSEVALSLGGKREVPLLNYKSEALPINGTVKAISDKPITCTGPMLKGVPLSLGRMAVLSTGSVEIMVTEKKGEALDLEVLRHMGIDPEKKKYTLIKSRQHYRAAFGPIARHLMWVCGPGPTHPDFSGFPFQHIERPMFPLDEETPFQLDRLGKW